MPWYQDLFSRGDPFREEIYHESESSRQDVDFAIEALELQPGDKVLDLCCGRGRHLIDLMRRGYDVTGVDLSEYLLSGCRDAASTENLHPVVVRADMRELQFDSEFDAVILMWNSFGYFESDEEDQKVLDGVARALKPGGRFLMDRLMNRDSLMRRFQPREWHENEAGDVFLSERTFDPCTGRIHVKETALRPSGERLEMCHDVRIYTYGELEKMLRASGMTVQAVWGNHDRSPFSMDSRIMEIIAVKDCDPSLTGHRPARICSAEARLSSDSSRRGRLGLPRE